MMSVLKTRLKIQVYSANKLLVNHDIFLQAAMLLLSFACVTHFNWESFIEQKPDI